MEVANNKWREIRDLGRGGFGVVSLCQKGNSDEFIAIKRCHHKGLAHDVNPRLMERWKIEVHVMGKLQHDNVIRSVELPPELYPQKDEPPILAMEFCEGGDLRKVLNLPQNCCGLREPEIRQLVSGVGSAIEYLHGLKIIHRDLKPENIVLKNINDRILYKIIDLGYIKELDNSSVCDSFVGTQQYLAPELNIRQPYTKTVDYWSFGTLIFECISGRRPFLPDATLVQWHDHIKQKSPDDITAYYDDDRKVVFSKSLPKQIHLCRPMKGYFEEWLRLMLRSDPKARGGGVLLIQERERPKCFYLMDQILKLKIVYILHVATNTILSFCVKEHHTIGDVQSAIEKEHEIPVADQVIIQAKGRKIGPSQKAYHVCTDPLSEDVFLFMFSYVPMRADSRKGKRPPGNVLAIIRDESALLVAKEQRKVWATAVLWICDQNKDSKRLVLGQRAALLYLLRCNSDITKQKNEMVKEMENLFACEAHFRTSLNVDLKFHSQRFKNMNLEENSQDKQMRERWSDTFKDLDNMTSVHADVDVLAQKVDKISTEIVELQRNPFGKSKPNSLEPLETEAKNLYDSLTCALRGGRSKDQKEMARLVSRCSKEQEQYFGTLYEHISKLMVCLKNLQPVLPKLTEVTERIISYRKQLHTMQEQRQEEIWKLLDNSLNGFTQNASQEQATSAMNEGSFFPFGGGASLLSSIGNSNLESIQLVDDSMANSQRLQTILQSMFDDHEESMSFLTTMHPSR